MIELRCDKSTSLHNNSTQGWTIYLLRCLLSSCLESQSSSILNLALVLAMVLAKSKNAVGLGNSLMNDRFGKGKGADRKKVSAGIHRTDQDGQTVCSFPYGNTYLTCSIVRHERSKRSSMGQNALCHGARSSGRVPQYS